VYIMMILGRIEGLATSFEFVVSLHWINPTQERASNIFSTFVTPFFFTKALNVSALFSFH
jgi:hypothetical protein